MRAGLSVNRHHAKHVTLQDIATACGVSKWTVSLALRDSSRISDATREQVQEKARELGYNAQYNHSAVRLAHMKKGESVRNDLTAFLFPPEMSGTHYFHEILRGVLHEFTLNRCSVVTSSIVWSENGLADKVLPSVIGRGEVDGALLLAKTGSLKRLHDALQADPGFGDRPAVALIWPLSGIDSVLTDDRSGAYEATRHLLELGHRRIAFLRFVRSENDPEIRRYEGMVQACRRRRLEPEDVLVPLVLHHPRWLVPAVDAAHTGEDTLQVGLPHAGKTSVSLVQALRAFPDVTALMGLNDATAIHAYHQLRAAGIDVPEQVSIVGFDDTDPVVNTEGRNILTTVRLPLFDVGRAGARLLLRRLDEIDAVPKDTVLPTEFVVRATTVEPRMQLHKTK